MRQCAHLFHRLKAIKTMRAYVPHNVDGNEDLLANLETVKSEVAAAQELAQEDVGLLRKVEEEKKASQAKTRNWLKKRRSWWPRKRRLKKKLSD